MCAVMTDTTTAVESASRGAPSLKAMATVSSAAIRPMDTIDTLASAFERTDGQIYLLC